MPCQTLFFLRFFVTGEKEETQTRRVGEEVGQRRWSTSDGSRKAGETREA
jgi:hypothetical protein